MGRIKQPDNAVEIDYCDSNYYIDVISDDWRTRSPKHSFATVGSGASKESAKRAAIRRLDRRKREVEKL